MNSEFGDKTMAFYSRAYILVRILRHASDKLTAKKDCIVSGYHDDVNFSATKMSAVIIKTRLVNQQKTTKMNKCKN